MTYIETDGDSIKLHIRLTPKGAKDSIGPIFEDRIKASVTSPPVDGKANDHLVKMLSKKLKVAKGKIEIVAGETSRNKTLKISGIDAKTVKTKLGL